SLFGQARRAPFTNLRMKQALLARRGIKQAIACQGQHELFKILAIHAKHLIPCASGTAESSFPVARNFFSNKLCPRCRRESTVPTGQSSTSAASARLSS